MGAEVHVPNSFIYVSENGAYDYARWLHISRRVEEQCILHLGDLCHPGRLSSLTTAASSLDDLRSLLRNGLLQITLGKGYVLMRVQDEDVHVEFRGHDDGAACRIGIKVEDLAKRIDTLAQQAVEISGNA